MHIFTFERLPLADVYHLGTPSSTGGTVHSLTERAHTGSAGSPSALSAALQLRGVVSATGSPVLPSPLSLPPTLNSPVGASPLSLPATYSVC